MTEGEQFPPRQVSLLLCDRDGRRLGALPQFEVEVPWWPEAEPVVAGARARYGIEVTVLRLVASPVSERAAGGPVTYLAEVAEPLRPLRCWRRGRPTRPTRCSTTRCGCRSPAPEDRTATSTGPTNGSTPRARTGSARPSR